ncbi:MAG: glycosyltransferase [Desulfobulbaceae bacterium]
MRTDSSRQFEISPTGVKVNAGGERLKLAYLTTSYPSVSHTFIRRELREIERRGHSILRLAIRQSNAALVDPIDQEEAAKTIHCLALPVWLHVISLFQTALLHPVRFWDAFCLTIKMGLRSDRGIFRHFFYLVEACTFLGILKKHAVQHVHVHFGTNSTAVARLIRRCGGPSYSFTTHGPTEFDSAIAFDLHGKIADAAFVIAISDYCSAQLRRWCTPTDWVKIHIVHCTVGDDFFNAGVPFDPDSQTFVSVGRLTAQKGQILLIDAFAQIIAAGHDAYLVLVGDGELRPLIEQRIAIAGIENRVIITGYVSEAEVRRHIASSRALVLPSFAEGLPMVIMEAFAIGRPVISTYVAGIPELVRSKENGWLVQAGNTDELAAALADALESPSSRLVEMAACGRDLTFQRHHTTTEGDKLEEILYRYVDKTPLPKKILAISSGGGHWVQLLRLRPAFEGQDVAYVTVHPDYASDVPGCRFYLINDATRWNKLGLIRMAIRVLLILLFFRPHVVISTGAASGYFALRFAKLIGARTIWLDSIANVEELSLTGKLVRPYADLWLTQWQELARPDGPDYRGAVL